MNNVSCNLTISNDLPYEVRSARFIEFFEAYLVDSFTHLDEEIRKYAMEAALAGGKRIRPLLVYHFAGHGLVSQESTIKASVILELVHLATLIHDDILDGAKMRGIYLQCMKKSVHTPPFYSAMHFLVLP